MSYRNKIYVAFHYGKKGDVKDGEKSFYHTFEMWRDHKNINFNFFDAHDLNNIKETSSDATIIARLQERLRDTKMMILLVGDQTRNRKWVKWELDQAKKRNIPLIVIETDKTQKEYNSYRMPQEVMDYRFAFSFFNLDSIKNAIDSWYSNHSSAENGKYYKY